ncbi:hypothetical protein N431DRAFT_564625 [Stipitochalara longipes BDJ]|nr:hypothetical protein N431DRAFT_564625 [Stipitochalara longipes BDJ]
MLSSTIILSLLSLLSVVPSSLGSPRPGMPNIDIAHTQWVKSAKNDNCYCASTQFLFGGDTICGYCGSLDGFDSILDCEDHSLWERCNAGWHCQPPPNADSFFFCTP